MKVDGGGTCIDEREGRYLSYPNQQQCRQTISVQAVGFAVEVDDGIERKNK
jgi:hypothetical protein